MVEVGDERQRSLEVLLYDIEPQLERSKPLLDVIEVSRDPLLLGD